MGHGQPWAWAWVTPHMVASHWGIGMGMGMGVECHEVGWIASLHIAMHCFGGYLLPHHYQQALVLLIHDDE